ncbi:hypothetical protein [Flavobacterium rhizosphaerae]|uniref:YhhN-like protein n=1 Tax=Flavobacterium rhizosphaerae TaxID=3163298 RepID=A0ABW8YWB4_9FLAO
MAFITNPVKLYILFTCVLFFILLKWKNKKHIGLLLLINLFTVIINSLLLQLKLPIKISSNINIIFTILLWLLILMKVSKLNKKAMSIILIAFFIFTILNVIIFDGYHNFIYNNFIIGSFIYIVLFIYFSFKNLQKEDLNFFYSNAYILLTVPLIFFFGFSFMFSFQDSKLTNVLLLNVKLYNIISFFSNFIYYTLLNIYIYRERKIK